MRIAVLGMQAGANTYYRAMLPAQELAGRGHDVRFHAVREPDMHLEALRDADVALFYRHCTKRAHAIASRLRADGVAIVYDNDDMVGSVTDDHPGRRGFGGLNGVKLYQQVRDMLRVAHMVTTPSSVLAQQYRETVDAVSVVENYVPNRFPDARRRPHDGVVVGWVAGSEHSIDRDRLQVRETLQALLATHPQLRVMTLGVALGIDDDRYEHVSYVDFSELPSALAGFDVGIAPLADVPVNRCRSTSKVKEYASVGVPWLASPIGPYRDLGEAQGGRLVQDDEWHAAIERLVTRDRERRRLAKRAARWGSDQVIGKHARKWEDVVERAVAAARAGG